MIGVVLDVSDRHEAFAAVSASESRQRLLINELNHRVKNTLATVQSIADQTARRSTSLDDFRASFEARLIALSATHNVLTRSGWEGAGLREILLNELQPYGEERVRLRGAEVELEARQALTLGMVFHELATNAAKYGALSNANGVVSVTWSVDLDSRRTLEIAWRESGGPPVAIPLRRGFGSRLIQGGVGRELDGDVELNYAPEGFCCTLRVPLSSGANAAAPRPFAF
jgi:two-component sensor histidine kinase